ncbi:MAG: M24 family metallopeptidase [Oscillospiraceae bacterium]|nr:M24 family metallopeptidase [Oscillospiraceae bacterium]
MRPELQELDGRLARFREAMGRVCPDWDNAVIVSTINQYYFTGTMQDGILLIGRDGRREYFVRRSHERASDESPLETVHPMESYRDAAAVYGADLGVTYIEGEAMPYAMLERLKRCFKIDKTGSMEHVARSVRAVKSPFELRWSEESGRLHRLLLTRDVPALLREGMSEAEMVGQTLERMAALGYQGVTRFFMYHVENICGMFGFGENSLYPTAFNGPGGNKGCCAAVPAGGDPGRRLKKGDLVFVDIAFGVNGYHTDKTQLYTFGAKPPEEAVLIHRACMDVQRRAAERLRPGEIPSRIWRDCIETLPDILKNGFMGYGRQCVKFLGHGVGLHVDELPVIAEGFDEPLAADMVVALEPKKGLAGFGMLGAEDTYIVSPDGGRCITGGCTDMIII